MNCVVYYKSAKNMSELSDNSVDLIITSKPKKKSIHRPTKTPYGYVKLAEEE